MLPRVRMRGAAHSGVVNCRCFLPCLSARMDGHGFPLRLARCHA
jgi:hypothetical protein